jgi:uncharacterized protein
LITGMGTLLNVISVLTGASLGVLMGNRLPEKMRQTLLAVLGLLTVLLGVEMALDTQNSLILLGALLIGALIGEGLDIDGALQRLGEWLEARLAGGKRDGTEGEAASQRFIKGFVTASLVLCVGPMTILGSIEDGLTGNFQILAIKSVLDGFAALAFASSLGVGVMFSALTVAILQGTLTLLAVQADALLTHPMRVEMFAAGGVVLMGLGSGSVLEIKPIRVANLLPALVIAPLIVAILTALGLPIAPSFLEQPSIVANDSQPCFAMPALWLECCGFQQLYGPPFAILNSLPCNVN